MLVGDSFARNDVIVRFWNVQKERLISKFLISNRCGTKKSSALAEDFLNTCAFMFFAIQRITECGCWNDGVLLWCCT